MVKVLIICHNNSKLKLGQEMLKKLLELGTTFVSDLEAQDALYYLCLLLARSNISKDYDLVEWIEL